MLPQICFTHLPQHTRPRFTPLKANSIDPADRKQRDNINHSAKNAQVHKRMIFA
jgi:hypothetical protein